MRRQTMAYMVLVNNGGGWRVLAGKHDHDEVLDAIRAAAQVVEPTLILDLEAVVEDARRRGVVPRSKCGGGGA
jgi:hypothetical protein